MRSFISSLKIINVAVHKAQSEGHQANIRDRPDPKIFL